MATVIKKSSKLAGIPVYYTGGNRWSDDKSEALQMSSEQADALMVNTDGKNGGWTGAVKETS
jgi:hypothetical protein